MERFHETAGGRGTKGPRRAFTLVEVIITIALMAILAGTVVIGSGMLGSSRLRAAAGLVVTAVRVAITRANSTGHAVRLVFDMDGKRLLLEETEDRMLRIKETTDSHKSEGAAAGADPATEAEKAATEYADGIVKGPRAPRARFKAVALGANEAEPGKGRELGTGVSYRQVHTEHDHKPRTEGRAYLYFWPGGETERAIIQLKRDDDTVLSVLVSPLTGRAKIERGKIELEERRMEEDFGTKEAP